MNKKLLPPKLHFLTPICTKSFVGWASPPALTGGAYSAKLDPWLYLWGLLLNGGKRRGSREEEMR